MGCVNPYFPYTGAARHINITLFWDQNIVPDSFHKTLNKEMYHFASMRLFLWFYLRK